MSELEVYVCEEKSDIIEITECWSFEDLQNSELNIEGYTLLRKDIIVGDKVRGRGVMLYIKSTLNATIRRLEQLDLASIFFQFFFKIRTIRSCFNFFLWMHLVWCWNWE